MEQSQTLLTAQVHFLDTNLALLHIPLDLYSNFVHPILQLVLPAESSNSEITADSSTGDEVTRSKRGWACQHPFVNISLTPVECSLACPVAIAEKLFKPIQANLDPTVKDRVSISEEQYVVIQVDGDGDEANAGQRVLELSSPLAMNGISIFFYTTAFSDYILVPLRSRAAVINALGERGFIFSKESEGFINVASPLLRLTSRRRNSASTASLSEHQDSYFSGTSSPLEPKPPSTPPPSSVSELEARTFKTLERRDITPAADQNIQLVQCNARGDTVQGKIGSHPSGLAIQHRLQLGIIKCLTTHPRARFFSLTLTDTEPASLLLEKSLLANFEAPNMTNPDDTVLLGNKDDIHVPITLDLRDLPLESTGIVCGIAGRLVGSRRLCIKDGPQGPRGAGQLEMSYLSTARAGTVIIKEDELESAMEALKVYHDKL